MLKMTSRTMRGLYVGCSLALVWNLAGAGAIVAHAQDIGRPDPALSEVERLPVSFERIKRQLAAISPSSEFSSPLRLNVRVDVYGRAPRLRFLDESFDTTAGPVPYGAPTHAEMQALVTPIEFRSPAVPLLSLNALLNWLRK